MKGVCAMAKNLNTTIPKPNSDPSKTTTTAIWKELLGDLFGRGRR